MHMTSRAVDVKRHRGFRATLFLYVLVLLRSCPNSANFSLVAYLHSTLHLGIVSSSMVITFLVGAVSVSTALMNIMSDVYIKHSTAIFAFGPFVILGYMLLALQAQLSSLHPPSCYMDKDNNSCEPAHGRNLALLYLSLLLFAVGEGCMRSCLPSFCADQFSTDDPNGSVLKRRSVTLHKLANSLGAILGLVFIVWVQNNLGWNIGFMVCALVVLVGLLVAACGIPIYQKNMPTGSPVTRVLQVIVAAFRKRHPVMHDSVALQEIGEAVCVDGEENLHPQRTEFLDKACIYAGDTSPWIFCSTTQVDETKAVMKMLPIFVGSLLIFLPFTLIMTLTIQVGRTMDKSISTFQISSASLIALPTTFHMLLQPVYSRVIALFLSWMTGNKHGISPLQQIGTGSLFGVVAASVAALVESKRKALITGAQRVIQAETDVQMSVFWLLIQFFLLSVMELASFNRLVEFIKRETPSRMKQIAPVVQSFLVGLATWLASIFIQIINRLTRYYNGGRGWLDGSNFNRSNLDRFFLLLATFEFIALINFCYWARKYAKENTKFSGRLEDEGHS